MPSTSGGVIVEPQGQTLVVDITTTGGNRPTVYSDQAGTTTTTLPATITTRTGFFIVERGEVLVSVKRDGVEIANGYNGQLHLGLENRSVTTIAPTIHAGPEDAQSRVIAAPISLLRPSAAIAETFPRASSTIIATVAAPGTGVLRLSAIPVPAGTLVSSISYLSGTTALSAGTHQWFALFDSNRVMLGATYDDIATAWSASALKTMPICRQTSADAAITTGTNVLTSATAAFTQADIGKQVSVIGAGAAGVPLGTSAAAVTIIAVDNATTAYLSANAGTTVSGALAYIQTPVRTTSHGLCYIGNMITATTLPTRTGLTTTTALAGLTPVLSGNSTTSLTTPPTSLTAAAPTAIVNLEYGYVS